MLSIACEALCSLLCTFSVSSLDICSFVLCVLVMPNFILLECCAVLSLGHCTCCFSSWNMLTLSPFFGCSFFKFWFKCQLLREVYPDSLIYTTVIPSCLCCKCLEPFAIYFKISLYLLIDNSYHCCKSLFHVFLPCLTAISMRG